jgi:hypothetical protein
MNKIQQTLQDLRDTLKAGVPNSRAGAVAGEYARLCTEAQERLSAVAVMLDQGGEYQALQAAEQAPPLLDVVAALSFGNEKAWHDFCIKHHLETAPRLEAATVKRLDALYAKGITANHPLYKDFRSAMLARDDEKALRLVQTILKLCPSDTNARNELQRLGNKRLQEMLEKLREALKGDDENLIASLTETVASLGEAEKLARMPAYVEGERLTVTLRRRQAEARLPELAKQARLHQTEGDWRATSRTLDTVASLVHDHGIDFSTGKLKEEVDSLTAFVTAEREAYEKQRKFETMLSGFTTFTDEVGVRLMTGAGVTYEEITQKDEIFVRRWKELEGFQLPVPADTLQRLRTVGQELRARLEQMEKARQRRSLTLLAAAIVVVAALAGLGFLAWKAHSLTTELAGYIEEKTLEPAEKLAAQLKTEGGMLTRWPQLQAKLSEVEAWSSKARLLQTQTNTSMQVIKDGLESQPVDQLQRQLAETKELINQLPVDLMVTQRNALNPLGTEVELAVSKAQDTLKSKLSEELVALEKETEDQLSFENPAEAVKKVAAALKEKLAPLEKELTPAEGVAPLATDIRSRILELRKKVTFFDEQIALFDKAKTDAEAADSLATYKTALGLWQDVKFAEAGLALKAVDALPSESRFFASLVTGGDEVALSKVSDEQDAFNFMPKTPTDNDIKGILELRNSLDLNAVYENTATVDKRIVFSRGKLKVEGSGASGKFYDPVESKGAAVFTEGSVQGGVERNKLSATSQMLVILQLPGVMDEDGEQFKRPVISLMQEVMRYKDAHVVARAYVMKKLADLAFRRSAEWGLSFSPLLTEDIQALTVIPGVSLLKSGDWMVPSVSNKIAPALEAFFGERTDRDYFGEANARRNLIRDVSRAGLRFAGYVKSDQTVFLNQAGRVATELWAVSSQGEKPLLVQPPSASPTAGESPVFKIEAALPLSPLFVVPLDRGSVREKYMAALKAAGVDPAKLTAECLFVTQP